MVQGEDSPLNALGTRIPIVDSAVIPATEASIQRNASVNALAVSTQPLPPFAQKADAVLKDELESRSNRNTEIQREDALPNSQDLETAAEALHLQSSDLVNSFVKGAMLPSQQLSQTAPALSSNEELDKEGGSPHLTVLKVLSLVNPGQIGHIDFTLINDDPSETADYTLSKTDLISKSGHRIPKAHINVSPNPGRIPPGESVDGRIEIRVPCKTPQDSYSGLLQTEDKSWLQAVIKLSVGP